MRTKLIITNCLENIIFEQYKLTGIDCEGMFGKVQLGRDYLL